MDEVHTKGGKDKQFLSYYDGLPAPEPRTTHSATAYKFSRSSRGVLLALCNTAKYYDAGKEVTVEGAQHTDTAQPHCISRAFAFVAPRLYALP